MIPLWLLEDRQTMSEVRRALLMIEGIDVDHIDALRVVYVHRFEDRVCRFVLGPCHTSKNPDGCRQATDLPVPTGRGWRQKLIEAIRERVGTTEGK